MMGIMYFRGNPKYMYEAGATPSDIPGRKKRTSQEKKASSLILRWFDRAVILFLISDILG
jgi:hypothetical protein